MKLKVVYTYYMQSNYRKSTFGTTVMHYNQFCYGKAAKKHTE